MSIPQWTEESVFDSYDISEETYKTVSSHDVKTAVLIPKGLKPGAHPVIFYIHGGFFVMAHGLFAPFWPKWMNKLGLENDAIIIAPDYRLLPSADGIQGQIEDVEDCWQWAKSTLPGILDTRAPGPTLDFSRTMLVGSSAGGYLSTQLALSHPDEYQMLAMTYPALDPKDSVFVNGPTADEPNILRFKPGDIPAKEPTLAWIEETRKDIRSKAGFERTAWAVGACHHGVFYSHIFNNKGQDKTDLFPTERVEAGEKLPRKVWIMHGSDDATVPIRGSNRFVDLVGELMPQTELRYDVVAGEDHGFDYNEESWESITPDVLKFLSNGWLN